MPPAAVDRSVLPEPGFLIGAEKITTHDGEVYEHRYAATGEVTYAVPLAGQQEVDAAVAAARAALPAWKRMPGNERRRLMLAFAAAVRASEHLAPIITVENAYPLAFTPYFTNWVAELFEFNAGYADKIGGEVVATFPGPAFDYTLDEPYGVVAVIVPWNGPFVSFGQWLAPALAAGNTIVIKPPEMAPYTCLALAELAVEVGFPPGVINVVPGGAVAGTALTSHRDVNKICFTGSGGTASRIVSASAPNLTPTAFELGGKSARIVFADADLDEAARRTLLGTGQACIAGSRVLVEAPVYDRLVEMSAALAAQVPMGDPFDPGTFVGPVISQGHADRILGFVDRAKEAGTGRLVTGGERLGGELADGYFLAPTIFADVDNSAEIAQEEIFGPVTAFMRFETEEEAVAIANDSEYGLAAHLETNDLRRAHRMARDLDAGTVWVNGFVDLPVGAPFGGVKRSGYGRQGGIWGIREFVQAKNVWMPL
ncbi:aldehyde dehydrogenase family protein [Trujillonella endophytica]|uniref:Acyl-CoA reductase n=1 Tax=Trujillonella endophytica TaxID=673521 RepID=A0A1H8VZI3_9ACTN|nr:aldehyde dehydrogenase family protein [Trujillella endophytica]SEP20348.1 Acyl-CoA reductase [Trujillella endophytica]